MMPMNRLVASILALVLLAGGALVVMAAPVADAADHDLRAAGPEAPHLTLVRTSPATDTTLAQGPAEIRLWFSEEPQMRGTSVRLTRGEDELVPSTDAAADAEDPKQVFIRPSTPLAAGSYMVHWRVIAQDGHTQRGTFSFRVGSE